MKLSTILIALVALCGLAIGADYTTGTPHQYRVGLIPNSAATAVAGTVYLTEIVLVNKSASAATVTITDRGTDCGGAACEFLSAITIEPGSTVAVKLDNQVSPGGISWVAGASNAIVGRIHFVTTMNIR